MVALDYKPVCGCGKPLKIFLSSGRAAKTCSEACARKEYPSYRANFARPQRPNHPCADCGKPVWSASVRCKPCSAALMARPAAKCQGCGKMFKKKRANHSYCSRECAFDNVDQWVTKPNPDKPAPFSKVRFNTCKQCGKRWTAKRASALCSIECSRSFADAIRKNKYVADLAMRSMVACACCGGLFLSTRRRKFCSSKCSDLIHRKSGSSHRKEKYGMTAKEWQRVRLMVFRRDEYLCYLCGDATDSSADVNGDRYPNAEHVVPVASGGQTVMSNLRCSHRACNLAKGAKVINVSA